MLEAPSDSAPPALPAFGVPVAAAAAVPAVPAVPAARASVPAPDAHGHATHCNRVHLVCRCSTAVAANAEAAVKFVGLDVSYAPRGNAAARAPRRTQR